MLDRLERLALTWLIFALGLVRRALSWSPRATLLMTLPALQPLLEGIARRRVRLVFLKAHMDCPAYADFLRTHGYAGRRPFRLADIPPTDKESYVKHYSIEQRCYGGAIPARGVMIDESSGSSGAPNNWVRGVSERQDVKRMLQISYRLQYRGQGRMILNAFALGPWATGMNVSLSLVDVGILKSIGPDAAKLEATLLTFGPGYEYVICGYPPFVKSFVDDAKLDLAAYTIDFVVGGEGISENLRAHLLRHARSVVSSYGASDLEIHLALETDLTIRLRQECLARPELCRALWGREDAPMIFQYNPLDYVVETLDGGAMAFTICRTDGAAPKIRYDLKDVGGVRTMRETVPVLAQHGLTLSALAPRHGHFPLLYVYGRGDLTVAFYGAKVYPTDVDQVVNGHPELTARVRSYQMSVREDEHADRRFMIHLELAPGVPADALAGLDLGDVFYGGLAAANQDFREVSRVFDRSRIIVSVHAHGTGPFAGADIRVKSRYIGETEKH